VFRPDQRNLDGDVAGQGLEGGHLLPRSSRFSFREDRGALHSLKSTMHKPRYPVSEEQIAELQRMDEFHGGGRSCISDIIQCLRDGDIETALAIRVSEGDKTRQYPDIEEHLHQIFGCRSHQKRECDHWLCKPIREERLKTLARGGWYPSKQST